MSEESASSENVSAEPAVIPAPKNIPEPGKLPRRFGSIVNFAGDEKLAESARKWLAIQLERFRGQEERKNFCDEDGVMDVADRMARVALRRDESSAQYQATISNVACTAFHKALRAMTAGECAMYFQDGGLPAVYETMGAEEETNRTGNTTVADCRNALAEYTWERDNRRAKITRGTYFLNKYGQQMYSDEWDYRVEERVERVPDGQGGFKFETKKRSVADHPTIILHDLANMYFDAQIEDMQQQLAILEESQIQFRLLAEQQAAGQIENVEKITAACFADKDYNPETREARSENAGEEATQRPTGLVRRWNAWAWLPVEIKDDKATWNESAMPRLCWLTFAGDISQGSAVCLRFVENPYHHKKNPYLLLHANPADDKGAYHLSPAETVVGLYWQAVTNWNQAHDNITLRTRAPMVADGAVFTRDLLYKANKLILTDRGVKLQPIESPRTTEITMPMAEKLEADIFATLGTDKPILGMPMLGRTSATEANTVYDQARVPLLQKADDNANDLFGWMMEMDAALWEQYADPELVVSLLKGPEVVEFKPSHIVGPFRIKVVAVRQYETRVNRRRAMNAFLAGGYQLAAPIMGKQGEHMFWTELAWKELGFGGANEIFPITGDFDARRVAMNETHSILVLGQWDDVNEEDNHRVHLAVHEPKAEEYRYLPDADKDPERERMHELHMARHRSYQASAAARLAPKMLGTGGPMGMGGPEQQGAGLTPGLPGEQAGNPIEAAMGAETGGVA